MIDSPPSRPDVPFEDGSAIRKVHNESIVLLGGGRALLMQIAEPRIAQGVAEHSSFQKGGFARLLRTLRPMFAIAFGTREQALAAARMVNRVHRSVRGEGYSAAEQDLRAWVMATLIDSALLVHGRFVAPLEPGEARRYYDQMKQFGSLLGVPPACLPPDVAGLAGYIEARIEGLRVSPIARRIAGDVFRATPVSWPLLWPLQQITAGLLPPALRDQFGMGWGPGRERALELTAKASRRALPLLPAGLRRPPFLLLP